MKTERKRGSKRNENKKKNSLWSTISTIVTGPSSNENTITPEPELNNNTNKIIPEFYNNHTEPEPKNNLTEPELKNNLTEPELKNNLTEQEIKNNLTESYFRFTETTYIKKPEFTENKNTTEFGVYENTTITDNGFTTKRPQDNNEEKNIFQKMDSFLTYLSTTVICFLILLIGYSMNEMYIYENEMNNDIAIFRHIKIIIFFGAVISSIIASYIDIFDKMAIIIVASIYYTASFLFLVPNPYIWLVSRFLFGISIGFSFTYASAYLQLIAPEGKSALFSSFFLVSLVFGISTPQFIILVCSKFEKLNHFVRIFRFLIAGIIFASTFFISEKEREKKKQYSIIDLFLHPESKKTIYFLFLIHLGQQFSGINGLMVFFTRIFESKGPISYGFIYTAIFSQVVGVIIHVFLVSNISHRYLCCASIIYCCIGYLLSILNCSSVMKYGAHIFFFGFALGFGGIPWIWPGEFVPEDYQKAAYSFSSIVSWFCAFLVSLTLEPCFSKIGFYTFIIYVVVMIIVFFHVIFFIPDAEFREKGFL